MSLPTTTSVSFPNSFGKVPFHLLTIPNKWNCTASPLAIASKNLSIQVSLTRKTPYAQLIVDKNERE